MEEQYGGDSSVARGEDAALEVTCNYRVCQVGHNCVDRRAGDMGREILVVVWMRHQEDLIIIHLDEVVLDEQSKFSFI